MKHAPMRVLNMILATTLVAASFSTTAFAQGFAPTQDGKEITSSRTQFNTTLPAPRASSFVLIPAISYGGSGMASVSTSNSDIRIDPKSATSTEMGVLAEFGRHTFVFQTGLMYMNEGANFTMQYVDPNSGNIQKSDAVANLKYLAVPLVGKARIRIADGVRLGVRAGVMAAVMMGLQSESDYSLTSAFGQTMSHYHTSSSEASGVRAVNAIAVVGGGPEIRVARNQNVRVEANYERFLLPVGQGDSDKITLHSWNAMLSYGIGF